MRGPSSLRGDVKAVPNRLMRESVITGFETNFDNPISIALALHVKVTADVVTDSRVPGYDGMRVRAIRNRVTKEIEPLSPGVIVSVRGSDEPAPSCTGQEPPPGSPSLTTRPNLGSG